MIKTSSSASKVFNNIENRTKSSIVSNVFGNDVTIDKSRMDYNEVPIEDITPRPVNEYTQNRIENLAESIRSTDDRLINPIVIVRPSDLPEDSQILKKYKEENVDVSKIKYVIVAGERRYRACLLNRELKAKELEGKEFKNPYDTITANILTKEEAQHEEIYYKDSNDQARQITPLEGIKHIEGILKQIKTDEDKRKALIEMNGEDGVPSDAEKAAKNFREDKYILYYLQKELGIEGWELSTIRAYSNVVKTCDKSIIDAVLAGEFPANQARKLVNLPKETQIQLLDIYKQNKAKYQSDLKEILKAKKTEKPMTTLKGKTIIDTELKGINKKIVSSIKMLNNYEEELGKSDREALKKIISDFENLNNRINEFIKK